MTLYHDATTEYWVSQLKGAKPTTLPFAKLGMAFGGVQPGQEATSCLVSTPISAASSKTTLAHRASVLRAAWAIVLSRHCETDDVCFAAAIPGGQTPVLEPRIVPLRVRLDPNQQVSAFLSGIETQASTMRAHAQFGLQNITRVSEDAKVACCFSNLLILRSDQHASQRSYDSLIFPTGAEILVPGEVDGSCFNHTLITHILMTKCGFEIRIEFSPQLLDKLQMTALSHHLGHTIQQLLQQGNARLCDLSLTGPWDIQQVQKWNRGHLKLDEPGTSVDALIADHAWRNRDSEAIASWDGTATYGELNDLADRLAGHLFSIGIGSSAVPICFEKSLWAIVAMLGITKAGGTFVPLNPSDPPRRRQTLVQQVGARIMVVSPSAAKLCENMAQHVVQITPDFLGQLSKPNVILASKSDNARTPQPRANDTAYIMFTSGSTGKPKGIAVDHSALCASVKGQAEAFNIGTASRVLQFSSYTFDISLGEILVTLACGGTVCVPSETQRMQDIAGFIREARVNTALLTSTFLTTLRPDEVPTLEKLIFVGEAPSKEDVQRWQPHVTLMNGYGPTEAVIICMAHSYKSPEETPTMIGRSFGSNKCWIVDPHNHHRLAPIGCAGELLVQGHALAHSYLDDFEKTEQSFIDGVDWLRAFPEASTERFYKTGDMARYSLDGTIEYLGRRDAQVKLHGHRIELGEIEHCIKEVLPEIQSTAVDVIHYGMTERLVAFVSFADGGYDISSKADSSDWVMPTSEAIQSSLDEAAHHLRLTLPPYMVPTSIIPLRALPFNTALKLDRKKLRTIATAISPKNRKRSPSTAMELKLRGLWAEVLNLAPEQIGADDGFLQIGGDSITAIKLVTLARRELIALTVAAIFESSSLCDLATAADVADDTTSHSVKPYSMLSTKDIGRLKQRLRDQCQLPKDQTIEDAYPCTKLQESFMVLAFKYPGSYTARFAYRLHERINIARFKSAWELTIQKCASLRTRIAFIDNEFIQFAVQNDISWEPTEGLDLQTLRTTIQSIEMGHGSRLCRYAVAMGPGGECYFVLILHHTIYDGWSVQPIMETLYAAYHESDTPSLPGYSQFVHYTAHLDRNASWNFWKTQLEGAKRATFPVTAPPIVQSQTGHRSNSRTMRSTIAFPQAMCTSITKATILRGAWAIVLARYCETSDICFGTAVSGRQAPLPGLESMVGPVIATVPVRIRFHRHQPVSTFLLEIQAQASAMSAHEQFGIQNIQSISEEAKGACDFSNLLLIQPHHLLKMPEKISSVIMVPAEGDMFGLEDASQGYFHYPLVMQPLVSSDSIELLITFDSRVLTESQVFALSQHYGHVVQQLLKQDETQIKDISLVGAWDTKKLSQWNEMRPRAITRACVQDLIAEQAHRAPDREAVFSWDGHLTYGALDDLSDRLGKYLVSLGVGPEGIVPICFEKSMWAVVAILGILKAGGAFVPLDPSHPSARRRALIQEVNASFMVVSPSIAQSDLQGHLRGELRIVELSAALMASLSGTDDASTSPLMQYAPRPNPDNMAYVMYTSGSTGKPKGIVVEHAALCSSVLSYTEGYGMDENSRVLQFSSYVFDVSIEEILATLAIGGVVCVPSDSQRLQNIAAFIRQADANTLQLTPSVARTILPEEVPNVKLLVLGGEAPSKEDIKTWYGRLKLINGYGPAEAVNCCSCHIYQSPSESAVCIGRGFYGNCWIVEPDDHNRLAPIGCVGELVVRGHALARGYLNDPERSRQSFIDHVDWAVDFDSYPSGRIYKTGDMARYAFDGTIEYLGRRDMQVKIHGQRVELGEIEYNIRQALPSIECTAVDVISQNGLEKLAAFIVLGDAGHKSGSVDNVDNGTTRFLPMNETIHTSITTILERLKATLPSHMVPSLFLPLEALPFGATSKLDRASLREWLAVVPAANLSQYAVSQHAIFQLPENTLQVGVRALWSQILNIPEDTIGIHDGFTELGGDSMHMIALFDLIRRRYNVSLNFVRIYSKQTTIKSVADFIKSKRNKSEVACIT